MATHFNLIYEYEPYTITRLYETYLEVCELDQHPPIRGPAKFLSLCISEKVFDNHRVVPFVFTAALFPISFLLIRHITKSDKIAVASCIMLLSSKIVGFLGPTVAYSPDWVCYGMLGLYLMYRKPILAAPVLFLAVSSKGLVFLLFPLFLYMTYRNTPNPRLLVGMMGVLSVIIFALWGTNNYWLIQNDGFYFNPEEINHAINNMAYVWRHEQVVWLILPLSIANLTILGFKYNNHAAKTVLGFITYYYMLVLLLPVFSMYDMFDYRMIPIIIFSCVGVSMVPYNPLFWKILNRTPYIRKHSQEIKTRLL